MSATQLKNGVRAWHEELLEFIIANPRASGAETALFFNVSESWISIVKNSDAFQELWATRRGEHFSKVSANIAERVTALAEVTVDALTKKVEQETREGSASIGTLKEVSDMALRSLGFGGGRGAPTIQLNTNGPTQVFIDKDTLARAREAKAKLHANSGTPVLSIEHSAEEAMETNSEK